MVYYIRFLKILKIESKDKKGCEAIKALVTITTDLGDDFYPADLELVAILVPTGPENIDRLSTSECIWQAGMRSLSIELLISKSKESTNPLRLCVSSNEDTTTQELHPYRMPKIISVWSGDLLFYKGKQESKTVERRFLLGDGLPLSIWEDSGESIARHLWDAGLATVSHFRTILQEPSKHPLQILSKTPKGMNVLELGSGCGIVGIALAQMVSRCNVLLTDLSEASDLLYNNISEARLASESRIAMIPLDWNCVLPQEVKAQPYDLILASDCTYNADSLPALVRTLKSLISFSPLAYIMVSMKVRHPSEAIFFDLMSKDRLSVTEHTCIILPDDHRSTIGVELEVIDIYTFRHQNALVSS